MGERRIYLTAGWKYDIPEESSEILITGTSLINSKSLFESKTIMVFLGEHKSRTKNYTNDFSGLINLFWIKDESSKI